MSAQDYVPTPSLPRPILDFSDWTDPVLGMPVVAILALVIALVVLLAYAIYASRSRRDDAGPPVETTP